MDNWLQAHYIEIVGVVFSVIYLLFSIRQNILLWPTGMISAILYMVVFFKAKFYADMDFSNSILPCSTNCMTNIAVNCFDME